MSSGHELLCVFWNVRGLNDLAKCEQVLADLRVKRLHLVVLQETKLAMPAASKLRSFFLDHLSAHALVDANGAPTDF